MATMKITTAQDVYDIVKARGLAIRVDPGPPPMPFLTKPPGAKDDAVTPTLLAALKAWRLELIDLVQGNGNGQG